MIQKAALPVLFSYVCLSLVSCQTKWTAQQKASLSSLSIPTPAVQASGYSKPQVQSAESQGATMNVSQSAFGLAGVLVSAAIMQGSQASYAAKNKDAFTQIENITPKNKIAAITQTAVTKRVSSLPFFAGKITPNSANTLNVKITQFGLMRLPVKEDLHSPGVTAHVEVVSGGRKILNLYLGGNGYADTNVAQGSATIAQYIANPKLLEDHYAIAIDELARRIQDQVRAKLGE
jgi:hypothetical protein